MLRCTIPVDNLELQIVREDVKRHCKCECREAKRNDFKLFHIIKEKAKLQHKYHLLVQEKKPRQAPSKMNDGHSGGGAPAKRGQRPRGAVSAKTPTPVPRKDHSPPKTGCWHCQGAHWLRECPSATEADKARAVEKMREVRDKDSTRAKKITKGSKPVEVTLSGLVSIAYCADSRADAAYVPRLALQELFGLGGRPTITALPERIEVEVAGGTSVSCSSAVELDLLLQTAAGPVNLPGTRCLVMEGSEREFILGNDMLVAMGIDVNHQLEQLATGGLLEEDDPFEEPEADVGLTPEAVSTRLLEMVVEAGEGEFDADYLPALREVVMEYKDVFCLDLNSELPALIEPLRIKLVDDAQPYRARPRRYPPAQRQFLRDYTALLKRMGFISENAQSHWASAAVPVAKPGQPGNFRMTIDYRPINTKTIPIAGAAIDLSESAQEAEGAYGFGEFDMPKGFWQLPLHPESQELMSFITTDTVYTPTRVPLGVTDSATHFQAQIKWCGCVFSGAGVRHDPEIISALQALSLPKTAADLQQFICVAGWIRDTLMDFGRAMQPLHAKLEGVLSVSGRTKRLAAGVELTWRDDERKMYADAVRLLGASQLLHFPNASAILCVFTDAPTVGGG